MTDAPERLRAMLEGGVAKGESSELLVCEFNQETSLGVVSNAPF
jgi:hypothetical protein